MGAVIFRCGQSVCCVVVFFGIQFFAYPFKVSAHIRLAEYRLGFGFAFRWRDYMGGIGRVLTFIFPPFPG